MEIKYSKYSFEEVHNTRENMRGRRNRKAENKEWNKLFLRNLPCWAIIICTLGFGLYYFYDIRALVYPLVYTKLLPIVKAEVLRINSLLCSSIIMTGAYVLLVVVFKEMYLFLARRLVPIKTPYIDKANLISAFLESTEPIDHLLELQKKIKEYKEAGAVLTITDGKSLEVLLPGTDFNKKFQFHLSEEQMDELEKADVLDFSYLDSEWEQLNNVS